jgi:RecB family endonuclease NucS
MTGIWMENVGGWSLQSPQAFENEKALHDMVLGTPELLPLSGSPRLTVIGREVMVSTGGRVDVLAVEPDGRPVLIEVKLRNNSESRRAVIAQALSYAAALHGVAYEDFESTVRTWLPSGLHEAVRGAVQDEALEVADFEAAPAEHLANGTFRVVIVLDEAPAELIGLVGYL